MSYALRTFRSERLRKSKDPYAPSPGSLHRYYVVLYVGTYVSTYVGVSLGSVAEGTADGSPPGLATAARLPDFFLPCTRMNA